MPITNDAQLPIRKIKIGGPAVDALERRKESGGPTEEFDATAALTFIRANPIDLRQLDSHIKK